MQGAHWHAPPGLRIRPPASDLLQIGLRDARVAFEQIPGRRAFRRETCPDTHTPEEMVQQLIGSRCVRQRARQKAAARADQLRFARRRTTNCRQAQARRAEHPDEPQRREHGDGDVEPRIAVELLGIVGRAEP